MRNITIRTSHGERKFAVEDLMNIAELLRSLQVDARVSASERMALETVSQILLETADDFGAQAALAGEGA